MGKKNTNFTKKRNKCNPTNKCSKQQSSKLKCLSVSPVKPTHKITSHDQADVRMIWKLWNLCLYVISLPFIPFTLVIKIMGSIYRKICGFCNELKRMFVDPLFRVSYSKVPDEENDIGFSRFGDAKRLARAEITLVENEKRIETLEGEKTVTELRLQEYKNEIGSLQINYNNALKRLQENEEKINVLQKEKGDALTRLSEVMGTKLRDNNPAITDLNDPNRPMKLGDQFSELYENEWTDAYSELMDLKKLTEMETIKVLLKILKEIYEICAEDVTQQLSGHRKTVNGLSDDEIEGFIKAVKDSVKSNASKYIPLLCKKITSSGSSCKTVVQYRDNCLSYIENCVKICYYAAVQNPPMVIDFEPGQIFDKQSYKEYTRSGTVVEYVVWPALYLHKGGPILSKGVVQPKK